MSVIPAVGRLEQEFCYKFKTSLGSQRFIGHPDIHKNHIIIIKL